MESKNILNNLINYVKSNRKNYMNTMMDIVVFTVTKLLKKKLNKRYIVNQQSLDAGGFNQYWSKLFSEIVGELNDKQADILIKKFGLDKDKELFESVQLNDDSEHSGLFEITELYQDKNNFIILENGSQLIRFEQGFGDMNISLLYHAKRTDSFLYFIKSICMFTKHKMSSYDVEILYYQYKKHYDITIDESYLDEAINYVKE